MEPKKPLMRVVSFSRRRRRGFCITPDITHSKEAPPKRAA